MWHSSKNYIIFHGLTKFWKGFIIYNLEHGIMAIKKHLTNEHGLNLVKHMMHKNDLEALHQYVS
jgi:hypothetical protein